MATVNITIIGFGPRGLTLLERILESAHRLPTGASIHIDAVDPGECGQGSHSALQPDHLLINTIASQVTMFPPDSVAGGENGATLLEWAIASGYRRIGRQFVRTADASSGVITEFDYLPRSLLGEYLSWFFEQVIQRLPNTITFTHHRALARDVQPTSEGFRVQLEDGRLIKSDYLFLATGHGRRKPTDEDLESIEFAKRHAPENEALAFYACPYPVTTLSQIPPGATVAIQGFGLTAHDVISELTVGRGGQFIGSEHSLRYLPSGYEPKLLMFSRNCLPFAARGVNQKGLVGRHQARFFTPATIHTLAEVGCVARGDRRIDFREDVLPLIITEMAYAYRSAGSVDPIDPATFEPSADEVRVIESILWPLRGKCFKSHDEFLSFFDEIFLDDLAHARLGNVSSPVKAATDALRDTREALRAAIEYGAATPESHRYFMEEFNAITNRLSFGPPKQRNVELAALRAAGVLDIGGGPGAHLSRDAITAKFVIETQYAKEDKKRYADVLIVARLDAWSPLTDGSPLTANLLNRGVIRPYRNGNYHPGGLDIDRQLRPIGRDGAVVPRIWALGFPVEGPHFYTHALPRAQLPSRQTADAECCVSQLFDAIAQSILERRFDEGKAEPARQTGLFEAAE